MLSKEDADRLRSLFGPSDTWIEGTEFGGWYRLEDKLTEFDVQSAKRHPNLVHNSGQLDVARTWPRSASRRGGFPGAVQHQAHRHCTSQRCPLDRMGWVWVGVTKPVPIVDLQVRSRVCAEPDEGLLEQILQAITARNRSTRRSGSKGGSRHE